MRTWRLISGGGSGHEPAHAGYVGRGMLSAAVAGDVFTSPPPDAVLAAIRAVTGQGGVRADRQELHRRSPELRPGRRAGEGRGFGGRDRGRRRRRGPGRLDGSDTGRRGLAGTVLVHKIAGAAAESGKTLAEVADEARRAAADVRTMGVALSACTVPAAGKPGFTLGETEIELGPGHPRRAGRPPRADRAGRRAGRRHAREARLRRGDRRRLLRASSSSTAWVARPRWSWRSSPVTPSRRWKDAAWRSSGSTSATS